MDQVRGSDPRTGSSPAANAGRVLIVDEPAEALAGICHALERENIEVLIHPSLTMLPPLLRSVEPDVILLDLSTLETPTKTLFDGGQLETPTPVVLFSNGPEPELERLSREIGAHGYLCKRDEVPAIVSRVKTWIAASRAARGA